MELSQDEAVGLLSGEVRANKQEKKKGKVALHGAKIVVSCCLNPDEQEGRINRIFSAGTR
jgi:hypothetical protein